jgi:hypothetical protein
MKKITKRDVYIFLLGMLTLFIIDAIVDWDDSVKSFKKGYYETIGESSYNQQK